MRLKLQIVFALLSVTFSSNAQNIIYWSGSSVNGYWDWGGGCTTSAGGNWYWSASEIGNRSRPDCYALFNKIYFNNDVNTIMNLNSLSDFSANQIVFINGTPDRVMSTDASRNIVFQNNNGNCKIENYVVGTTHTFNVPIFVNSGENYMEINPVNGYLLFNNTIRNNSNNPINIYGAQQVSFSGDITGTPGVTINNTATVVYNGVSKTYSGTTTINNGTKLKISTNQTLGNILLNGGTLQVDVGVTLTITGTYTATGGTIDNKGTIKFAGGSVTFPGYANVNNGIANTLTNIEAASSANLILNKTIDVTGTIFVSDNAIFDTSNHSVGGTGTNLTMTGTSKYKTRGYGSKPDASGSYSLAPATTIEFYGTSATDIRYGSPPIYYANIIVNGSNISNAGTANGIRFQTAGTFVVKNGATFNINTTAGFTSGTNTGINTITNGGPIITLETGSTIEYAKTGDQTITPFSPAYSNLTISGSGIKTTTATTVNVGNDLNITASQLTIKAAQTFVVTNKVNNSGGTVIIENNGSLVQINDNVVNTGNITYQRRSNSDRNTDYTYWSTPVSSSQTLFNLFPETLDDMYYSYEVTSSSEDWKKETSATTMDVGKGYIVRGPEPNPPFPLSFPSASFLGTPNNGIIKISGVFQNKSYLLGNPYPSALNADKFLAANSGVLDGTLYFWTHNTEIKDRNNFTITDPMTGITTTTAGSGSYAYTSNDYASYNGVGGVAASGGTIPSGNITTAQGFFASSNTAIIGTNEIIFDNSMRVDNSGNIMNNTQFFKTISPKTKLLNIEKHRIWLDLKNTQGAFKQTLIGYITNATNEYDSRFDGESFDANEFVDFYSINQDKNLVIQGRALPFDENDEVPLGYRTTIEGAFTINIDQVDGILINQAVFIEDKLTNTVFDLKNGNYTFTTEKGTFNDRFILRYTNKTLGTTDLETLENQVLVSNKNKQIKVNSAVEIIDKVFVYDLLGRQLFKKEKVDSNELTLTNFNSSQQTLLVKVSLQNGQTVTRKVMY